MLCHPNFRDEGDRICSGSVEEDAAAGLQHAQVDSWNSWRINCRDPEGAPVPPGDTSCYHLEILYVGRLGQP